jgi:hypothetical protein
MSVVVVVEAAGEVVVDASVAVVVVVVKVVVDGPGEVVVVTSVVLTTTMVVVVVEVVIGGVMRAGQDRPAGRGSQMSVSVFLSFRRGRPAVVARTLIFRFPALRPRAFSFTTFSVSAPHSELSSAGTATADLGLGFTLPSGSGVQPARVWLRQRAIRKVQASFAEATPSSSQAGSQSVHLISVESPLASRSNSARQSVPGSDPPPIRAPRAGTTNATATANPTIVSAKAVRELPGTVRSPAPAHRRAGMRRDDHFSNV